MESGPERHPRMQLLATVEGREILLRQDSAQFEATRLRFVLQMFGLGRRAHELISLWREAHGQPELRFAAFNQLFPSFPFTLGSHTLKGVAVPWGTKITGLDYAVHRDPYATEPSRFKKYQWTPFVIAYRDFYATAIASGSLRRVGLVFPRKGFLHGMCIHDDDSEQFWGNGLCWVYKFVDGQDRERRLYVQPFRALMRAVRDSHWQPD